MRSHVISDDAFAHMVSQEVKNKASAEERQFLAESQNIGRWLRALDALCAHLNEQIESCELDMESDLRRYEGMGEDGLGLAAEARHYYEQKISKIKKFRFYVLRKISEVQGIKAKSEVGSVDQEKKILICRDAILAHKMYLLKYDIETTPADEALYLALDGIWKFDEIKNPEEEISDEEKIGENRKNLRRT